MSKKSHAGVFFKIIQEEIGDCTDFHLTYQKNPESKPEMLRVSHSEDDGFMALIKLMKKVGIYNIDNFAKMNEVVRPPSSTILKQFFIKSLNASFHAPLFRGFNTTNKNNYKELPPAHASTTLTYDESKQIDEYCLKNKIPPMALLLYSLDQEVLTRLESKKQRYWMVPVSLRSKIEPDGTEIDPLMTGFMDISLPENSPQDLALQIRQEFKKNSHWVGFYAFGLARFIPLWLMKPLVKMQAKLQSRVGNFSYMGRWGNESNPTQEVICGYPPVVRNQPVAGIAIHWGGRLTLNFIMHPFVTRDPKVAESVVIGWKNRLLLLTK